MNNMLGGQPDIGALRNGLSTEMRTEGLAAHVQGNIFKLIWTNLGNVMWTNFRQPMSYQLDQILHGKVNYEK